MSEKDFVSSLIMTSSQLIPMIVFLAVVFLYLLLSTRFRPGWMRRGIVVKGGRINLLLFLLVVFVVLFVVVKTVIK